MIYPSVGIRNYFYFDGENWQTEPSGKSLLYILEFIDSGIVGRETYIAMRLDAYPREEMYKLWKTVWDDKMFNCACSYGEGIDDSVDGFCIDMNNAGTLHGGNLFILKKRIEKYFNNKKSIL